MAEDWAVCQLRGIMGKHVCSGDTCALIYDWLATPNIWDPPKQLMFLAGRHVLAMFQAHLLVNSMKLVIPVHFTS